MMREIKSAFILDKSVGNRKIATIPEPGYLQSPIQKPNLMSTKTENLTCLWMCLKYIILLCDISVCYFVCVFGYVLAFEYNSQWNWMVIILRINGWIVCNIFFFWSVGIIVISFGLVQKMSLANLFISNGSDSRKRVMCVCVYFLLTELVLSSNIWMNDIEKKGDELHEMWLITWQRSLWVHAPIRIVPNWRQIVSSMVHLQRAVDSVVALQLSLLD